MNGFFERASFPLVVVGSTALALFAAPRVGGDAAFGMGIALAIAAILALERAMPYRESWRPTRSEMALDVAHLVMALAASTLTQAVLVRLVPRSTLFATLPLVPAIAVAVALGDLAPYWFHRLSHETNGRLWAIHAVHHAPEKMSFWNASRFHPLNVVVTVALRASTVRLLGFADPVVLAASVLGMVVNAFSHANVRVTLGPLNWFFAGPELHREHHDRDLARGTTNYGGVVIVWDALFGTRREPGSEHAIGIDGPAPAERFLAQMLFPWRSCCARAS